MLFQETSASKASVLVADDAPEMRAMLADLLTRDGFEVTEAANGREVLALLGLVPDARSLRPFDLVITDVRMPVVNGVELLRALRASRLFATPVIVLTGFGSRELHAETQRLGAALTLNKPVASLALRDAVRKLVDPPWW